MKKNARGRPEDWLKKMNDFEGVKNETVEGVCETRDRDWNETMKKVIFEGVKNEKKKRRIETEKHLRKRKEETRKSTQKKNEFWTEFEDECQPPL